MKVSDILKDTAFVHLSGDTDKEVEGAYICDLLSFVIGHIKEKNAWLTVQTHLNTLAIADMLDIPCLIIVDDAKIDEETIVKAREENITLLKTHLNSYEVIRRVFLND